MQPVQKILIIIIVSLTTLLLVVGFQVLMILKDAQKTIKRLNTLLDDSILGGGLLRPEKLTAIFQLFRKDKTKNKDNSTI